MSILTLFLYVVVLSLWVWSVHREGGIGIGVRFMFAFSMVQQFLVGPPLYFLSGLAESDLEYRNREQAVQLVLYCMLGFVVIAYAVTPLLLRQPVLRMDVAWKPFAHPLRLEQEWLVGTRLMQVAVVVMVAYPVLMSIPTVRAIASQLLLVIDTGLTVMMVNIMLSGRRDRLMYIVGWLVFLSVYRAIFSGFLGGTMVTGLFLLALLTMGRSSSIRSWLFLGLWLYLLLVPYTIWLSIRADLRDSIKRNAPIAERLESIDLQRANPRMLGLSDPDDLKLIQHRIDQSHLLSEAMRHTPAKEPFAEGATIVQDVVYSMVPRFLWPEKPVRLGGSEFVSRFTGRRFATNTSVGLNYVFEFYVNFGPLGAVICVMAFGLACGATDYYFFRAGPRSFCVEWTVVQCMWQLCVHSTQMAQLAMSLPVAIFDGWLLGRFFFASRLAPVYFNPPPPRSGLSSTSIRLPPQSASSSVRIPPASTGSAKRSPASGAAAQPLSTPPALPGPPPMPEPR